MRKMKQQRKRLLVWVTVFAMCVMSFGAYYTFSDENSSRSAGKDALAEGTTAIAKTTATTAAKGTTAKSTTTQEKSYTIEHYIQLSKGSTKYGLARTQSLSAGVNKTVTATVQTFAGYKVNMTHKDTVAKGIVSADKVTTLKLYYDAADTKTAAYKVDYYLSYYYPRDYKLSKTLYYPGTVGSKVTAPAGFINTGQPFYYEEKKGVDRVASGTVKADGSLALRLYYYYTTGTAVYPSTSTTAKPAATAGTTGKATTATTAKGTTATTAKATTATTAKGTTATTAKATTATTAKGTTATTAKATTATTAKGTTATTAKATTATTAKGTTATTAKATTATTAKGTTATTATTSGTTATTALANQAEYKVEFYGQKDGADKTYVLKATSKLKGTVGATVSAGDPAESSLAGMVENPTVSGRIVTGVVKADGSLVLRRYYDYPKESKTYTVEHYIQLSKGSTKYGLARSETFIGAANSTVTADVLAFTGYKVNMDNKDTVAKGTVSSDKVTTLKLYYDAVDAKTAAYKVDYYLSYYYPRDYKIAKTLYYSGTVGSKVTAPAGFINVGRPFYYEEKKGVDRVASGTVKADGSLVLKLYYYYTTGTAVYPSTGTTATKPTTATTVTTATTAKPTTATTVTTATTAKPTTAATVTTAKPTTATMVTTATTAKPTTATMVTTATTAKPTTATIVTTATTAKPTTATMVTTATTAKPTTSTMLTTVTTAQVTTATSVSTTTARQTTATTATVGAVTTASASTSSVKAAYKVEHFKQNTGGSYELVNTDYLTGNVGQSVTAVPKSYSGYSQTNVTKKTVSNGVISADGNLILKLYYISGAAVTTATTAGDSVTTTASEAVSASTTSADAEETASENGDASDTDTESVDEEDASDTDTESSDEEDASDTNTESVEEDDSSDSTDTDSQNEDADNENATTAEDSSTTDDSDSTQGDDTASYKVIYYKYSDFCGRYIVADAETLSGTVGEKVNADTKDYSGYEQDSDYRWTCDNGTVDQNGTLVLRLFYNKDSQESPVSAKVSDFKLVTVDGKEASETQAIRRFEFFNTEVDATISTTDGTLQQDDEVVITPFLSGHGFLKLTFGFGLCWGGLSGVDVTDEDGTVVGSYVLNRSGNLIVRLNDKVKDKSSIKVKINVVDPICNIGFDSGTSDIKVGDQTKTIMFGGATTMESGDIIGDSTQATTTETQTTTTAQATDGEASVDADDDSSDTDTESVSEEDSTEEDSSEDDSEDSTDEESDEDSTADTEAAE